MPPRVASRFASRGAFDALAPSDEPDQTSEEGQEDLVSPTPSSPAESANNDVSDATPARITRTQQKKLAKEARDAKKVKQTPITTPTPTTTQSSQTADKIEDGVGQPTSASPPVSSAIDDIKETLSSAASNPVVDLPATGNGVHQPSQKQETLLPPPSKSSQATREPAVTPSLAAAKSSSSPSTLAPPGKKATPLPSSSGPSTTDVEEKRRAENAAYWKKVRERAIFGFLMIGAFILLLSLGHPYMIVLVIGLQTLVYREVTALFEIPGRPSITGGAPRRSPLSRQNSNSGVPRIHIGSASAADESAQVSEDEEDFRAEVRKELVWSKTLSWYFFTVANYFLYGESLIYYFKHIVFIDSYFIPFAKHHRFLSFLLYIIGFVGFVSGLRRENLKHQFGLFGWVHMSLLLIVFSSHFLVNNILEGLIWLFLPASLVICNDVFAYVCGMIWGRTPLISLSPKKTVEGFVGAFVITEVFAVFWATIFQRSNYLICPAISLGMNAFQDIQCTPNAVFEWRAFVLPASFTSLLNKTLHLSLTSIPYTEFQFHSLVMAAFASLVAPFGGFFASGFKRAFNIKDFGDSIPGHGGLTDRFDCQFLMGLFSYVYYSSLIREHRVTVGSVLQTVVTHLTVEEQVETYREIGRFLAGRGMAV